MYCASLCHSNTRLQETHQHAQYLPIKLHEALVSQRVIRMYTGSNQTYSICDVCTRPRRLCCMLCDLSQKARIDQRDGKGILRCMAGLVGSEYVKVCITDCTSTQQQPELACCMTACMSDESIREWDKSKLLEPLELLEHGGRSHTARLPVVLAFSWSEQGEGALLSETTTHATHQRLTSSSVFFCFSRVAFMSTSLYWHAFSRPWISAVSRSSSWRHSRSPGSASS